jgi:hypothetical protein
MQSYEGCMNSVKGSENIEEKHETGAGREKCKEFRNRHVSSSQFKKTRPARVSANIQKND